MKETYSSFISQFEITENPIKVDGYHAHHIIPRTEQKKLGITDNRCVMLKYSQHGYAHWLYDKEHDTHTTSTFLGRVKKTFKDIKGYEDFLPLDSQPWVSEEHIKQLAELAKGRPMPEEARKTISEKLKGNKNGCGHVVTEETRKVLSEKNKGKEAWNKDRTGVYSDETRKRMSESMKGNTNSLGVKWYTDGSINIVLREDEAVPSGFVNGKVGEVWNKGRTGVYSEETLKKMSEASKGEKNHWYGTHGPMYGKEAWNKGKTGIYNEETLKKMSKSLKEAFSSPEVKERMSKSQKGIRWWTDGINSIRSRECPGPEWHQGRTFNRYS